MTPTEAIEKEIKREKKELDDLEDEKKRLIEEMKKAKTEDKKMEITEQLLEVLIKLVHREELEEEIEGKKKALRAAKDSPDDPVGGIDSEIDSEMAKAAEVGRKAQELREKAWKDEQQGKKDDAKKARDEAKKLSHEHDLELARLRGKGEARRAVQRALRK